MSHEQVHKDMEAVVDSVDDVATILKEEAKKLHDQSVKLKKALHKDESFDSLQQQIIKAKGLEDEKFKIIDHYHEFPRRFDKEYQTCPSMQFLTIIGADSKVYSCQDKAYTDEGLLGSIENKRFKEFWFSKENYDRIRSINPSIHCNHHCVEHQKNLLLHEYLGADQNHVEFV